jgi:hypothetical protein
MLTSLGVIKVAALMAPTFTVYASIILSLGVELAGLLSISLSIGITPPTLALNLQVVVSLIVALTVMLAFNLPSVDLSVSFNAQLVILLGIAAALRVALSVGGVAGIEAIAYGGTSIGPALTSVIPAGETTAFVFGSTSTAAAAALAQLFDGITFPQGVDVIGEITLSAMLSSQFALLTGLYNEFNARANAMAKATASLTLLPPTVAASIALFVKLEARIRMALSIGMPAVSAKLAASVQVRISLISSLVAKINAALSIATDGFDVYRYEGDGAGLGAALGSALAGGWPDGAPVNANASVLVLNATTPAASAAVTTLFPPLAA